MRACHELDAYLDGRLDEKAAQRFEEHLRSCSRCRQRAVQWHRVRGDLKAWAGTMNPPRATQGKAEVLVARAMRRRRARGSVGRTAMRTSLALAGAAAVLVLVVGLYLVIQRVWVGGDRHRDWAPAHWSVVRRMLVRGRMTQVGSVGLVLEGDGRAEAELMDKQVRVILDRGTLVAFVRHETGGGGRRRRLVVEARGYEIHDVGTRFSVSVDPGGKLSVALLDGRLRVIKKRRIRRKGRENRVAGTGRRGGLAALESGGLVIDEGRTLEIIDAARPSAVGADLGEKVGIRIRKLADSERRRIVHWVGGGAGREPLGGGRGARASRHVSDERGRPRAVSSMRSQVHRADFGYDPGRVKDLVLEGRLGEAVMLLEARLKLHSSDGRAWSMLGDCRRKQGRWTEAVRAYRKAARFGSGSIRRRAVYLAASMLQDRLGRCRAAVALLDEFLAAGGGPLQPEALVRKARCLARMGRRVEALSLLRRVETRFGGTTAAVRARRIIKRLGDTRPRGVR